MHLTSTADFQHPARWRDRLGAGRAYFVALDYLTNRAHRELFPDDADRLVVNPEAWLLFVANVATDDPESRVSIAELVADSVVRETVMALATGHTLDEVLEIAAVLCADDEPPSARELRELDSPSLLDHIDQLVDEQQTPLANRAAVVLQRRSQRGNQRAMRVEDASKDAIEKAELEAKVASERAAQATSENRALSEDVAAERKRADRAEDRMKRLGTALVSGVVALAVLLGLALGGWISGFGLALGVVLLVLWGLYAWRWVDGEDSLFALGRAFLIEVLLLLLATLLP